jgi:repressor LexA
MREGLTIKQRITLECIDNYINEHGYSPTYQELAAELSCDINTAYKKVVILTDKGYVTSVNGKSRTLKVIKRYD